MRAFIPKGHTRPIITSDNKDLKSYRQEVAKAALAERNRIGIYEIIFSKHVPVVATFKFYFAKPESVSKKRGAHVVRPDVSKLIRATEDALTGIVYLDDAQIVEEHAYKFYGMPERVEIKIEGKFTDAPQSLLVSTDDNF